MHLRHCQPIADKNDRRFKTRRLLDAHIESCFIAKLDRLNIAIAHQCQTRLLFDDATRAKADRLKVAIRASRQQSRTLKIICDVLGCQPMSKASSIAAFEFVVSQESYMRPPALCRIGR